MQSSSTPTASATEFRPRYKGALGTIHPKEHFRAIMEHERKRSDRTDDKFSVVVIDVKEQVRKKDFDALNRVADALLKRLRTTDEVGWFDREHLGILLLDTAVAGAWKVTDDLKRMVASLLPEASFQVYAYPSKYLEGEKSTNVVLPVSEGPEGEPEDSSARQGAEFRTVCALGLEPHLGLAIPKWKRAFDVFASIVGGLVLLPLWVLIGLMIKTLSPGPIFFRQTRVGYLGERFTLFKFRTMKVNTNRASYENYVSSLIKTDTPMKKLTQKKDMVFMGSFLRKTGLDELPQLINVLHGEMSLVGPRPCVPVEFDQYLHWHKRRFFTLPGITGLWQVMGKHDLTFKEMIRYDISYEQDRSFFVDLAIIFKTFPAVLKMSTDG